MLFAVFSRLYDFSYGNQIVDVGGGFGRLITSLLEKYFHLKRVLLDTPDVIAAARERLTWCLAPNGLLSRARQQGVAKSGFSLPC
jgi:hypothetical protein